MNPFIRFTLASLIAIAGCNATPNPAPARQPLVVPETPTPTPVQPPPVEGQTTTPAAPATIPPQTVAVIDALGRCTSSLPNHDEEDCDGDGVRNGIDRCPSQDEDGTTQAPLDPSRDPEHRGCPQNDRDGDGYGDQNDHCPDAPKGDHDNHGCPDSDTDGDGVYDHGEHPDECRTRPVQSEGHSTAPSADSTHAGCPAGAEVDPDSDGDKILDVEDQCANEAASDHPNPDRLGCPDGDHDHDQVRDHADWCPNIAVRSEQTNTAPPASLDWPGCPEHQGPTANSNNAQAQAQTPAPPVATSTSNTATPTPNNMVAASRVLVALGTNANAAARLCAPRTVQSLTATGACAVGEAYCFRVVTGAVYTPCDITNPTPGCVMATQSINPCVEGAERVVAIQCGPTTVGCTPENVAAVAMREGDAQAHRRYSTRDSYTARMIFGDLSVTIGK